MEAAAGGPVEAASEGSSEESRSSRVTWEELATTDAAPLPAGLREGPAVEPAFGRLTS